MHVIKLRVYDTFYFNAHNYMQNTCVTRKWVWPEHGMKLGASVFIQVYDYKLGISYLFMGLI